jgi:hypothetical protein
MLPLEWHLEEIPTPAHQAASFGSVAHTTDIDRLSSQTKGYSQMIEEANFGKNLRSLVVQVDNRELRTNTPRLESFNVTIHGTRKKVSGKKSPQVLQSDLVDSVHP